MTVYLYCYASGLAKFGSKLPDGALLIDKRTKRQLDSDRKKVRASKRAWSNGTSNTSPVTSWREQMRTKMRLGYDGTMLVPGIPEADTQDEKLDALFKFKKWAVE